MVLYKLGMVKEQKIYGLFPIPVGHFQIDLSEQNKKCLEDLEKNMELNKHNYISNNKYVLEEINLKDLKINLLTGVSSFVKNIYDPLNEDLSIYITQSWLNITNEKESHHAHDHPNSIWSAVFYYDVGEEDSIKFHNMSPRFFSIIPKNYNSFNSVSWNIKVSKNDVLVFPSTLWHNVDVKKDKYLRKSLAFNIFLKGKLGDAKDSTELIL